MKHESFFMSAQGNKHIQFDPELDRVFGTIEALILALIDFRSQIVEPDNNGFRWVALSKSEIIETWIPSISLSTLKRHLNNLANERGVIKCIQAHPCTRDKTNAYRIDYPALYKHAPNTILASSFSETNTTHVVRPLGQNEPIHGFKMNTSRGQNEPMHGAKSNQCINEKNLKNYTKEKKEVQSFF